MAKSKTEKMMRARNRRSSESLALEIEKFNKKFMNEKRAKKHETRRTIQNARKARQQNNG